MVVAVIGARLRELRLERGLSQADLAKAIGSSAVTISQYEIGWRTPRLPRLGEIARALGVPASALLEPANDVPSAS